MLACSSSNEKTTTPNATLENTRWGLRSLNDKKVFIPEGGKEIFIIFKKDENKFNGNAGCNNMFGAYLKKGSELKIGPVARTEMFCEQQMETENNFVKALETVDKYKVKGDQLYLYEAAKLLAVFDAVYMN